MQNRPSLHHYYILHKPYEMLSQFVGGDTGLRMLSHLGHRFPDGIHAVGRLDYHSEGLLLLTTNSRVTKLLFEGPVRHRRTYVVQAYKNMSTATVAELQSGVHLKIKGGIDYITASCFVDRIVRPEFLAVAAHELPAFIPHTWLQMALTEGKYRQIRKMLKAVYHPCRRLVRTAIEDVQLGDLKAGEIRELAEDVFFRLLKIDNHD